MTIRDLVRGYILEDSEVASVLGTRLYPKRLPAKVTYPAGVIQKIDIIRPSHLRGSSSLAKARVQVDVYCNANGAADIGMSGSDAVVDLIGGFIRRRLLDGSSVTFTDTSVSPAVEVKAWITHDIETEGDEADLHGGTSRYSDDFLVEYQTQSGAY